jgi:predicted dienelactone hydrolase
LQSTGVLPVLIYYPGGCSHRMSNAALCEALASRGFVVLALDAPRDAPVVVFPDGRMVTPPAPEIESYIWPRVADCAVSA